MKRTLSILLLSVIAISCFPNDNRERDALKESLYEPITVNRTDLDNRVNLQGLQSIMDAGKIYVKDDFLFINEREIGVHIFYNLDPTNPISKAFIAIDGNTDIAVKENVTYAHHITDLIAIEYNTRLNTM